MGITSAKQILIAPLDWGLGHTTRCVPLIRHLYASGHGVLAAGNEGQLSFLTSLFPQLPVLLLDGYSVQYSRTRRAMIPTLLKQIPRIAGAIKREHQWLRRLVTERKIDGIISDNRYGLYHEQIPSVIITHQARVLTGIGKPADGLAQRLHYRALQKFGACWIADVPGTPNLGGQLSHPDELPRNATYLGLLSQMNPLPAGDPPGGKHLLVLLSGPEPQRTLLSRMLWQQVASYEGAVVFVEGSDAVQSPDDIPGHIQYFKRLTAAALQPLLEGASIVICRSGYSTLMDLCLLRKKAILIPTPGQTEQEYLGRHLEREGIYLHHPQQGFSLVQALEQARHFPFHPPLQAESFLQFKPVLDQWVAGL